MEKTTKYVQTYSWKESTSVQTQESKQDRSLCQERVLTDWDRNSYDYDKAYPNKESTYMQAQASKQDESTFQACCSRIDFDNWQSDGTSTWNMLLLHVLSPLVQLEVGFSKIKECQ